MHLVTTEEIEATGSDALALIILLAEKYYHLISSDTTGQIQQRMTAEQSVLLAYITMDNEVNNGGFIQLIENGFGSYIFDNHLSDYLREWGAADTADILDQARTIYLAKKNILEKEKTLEEFARLYQEHPDFEAIESRYYAIADTQRATIRDYISTHIALFDSLS
jgi:hypothetical protein